VPLGLLAALTISPHLSAQTNEELQKQLAAERAAREELERRIAELEKRMTPSETDEMERQLQLLVEPGGLDQAATRPPSSPAFYNPAIGVIMDGVADAGNFDNKLGERSDRFSLRETEIDMRLPLSPFATGVGIFTWDNEGDNEFSTSIEEGYADIALGKMFDKDWDTTAKVGRFRPLFGRNNQLHRHDWLQVYQPLAVQNLLGDEGVVGEGFMFNTPLFHSGDEPGIGRTTTLNVALVNGDLFTGTDNAPGGDADAAGDPMHSQAPMAVSRLSEFMELGTQSDVELGVSNITSLDHDTLVLDSGQEVDASYWDADVTWRRRDNESGVGSWLVQAEMISARLDDNGAGVFLDDRRDGWWTTVQRQISPTVYLGVMYGESDTLDSTARQTGVSPYISWYADEFFRIRTQYDHLEQDDSTNDFSDAHRISMQFTWNFGVHAPHPYWVNK